MEVKKQGKVKRVDVSDETGLIGFELQSTLELKEPGLLSTTNLVATLSGKPALYQFKKGDLVAVNLNCHQYNKNGEFINHISITDIKLVKELDYLFL